MDGIILPHGRLETLAALYSMYLYNRLHYSLTRIS